MPNCIWFRQDLRLRDNTALRESLNDDLIALYVITPKTWQTHQWAECKIDFTLRQLHVLSEELASYGIPLKILEVPTYSEVPKALTKFCEQYHIKTVYANRQLLVDEIERDHAALNLLHKFHISLQLYDDATLLPPEKTVKKDGEPFKVFTPFKKNFLQVITPGDYLAQTVRIKKQHINVKPDKIPGHCAAITELQWPVGEKHAQYRLKKFYQNKIEFYEKERDFPALDSTSQISPYLACGNLSSRQCITTLLDFTKTQEMQQLMKKPGIGCWVSELIWREFYYTVAFLFPQVVKHRAFKPETEKLNWSQSKKNFQAWCEGRTGFPLVDAGMRQLNQTGWMHNRLRMVTAMFLTKTLFINWRWGEDYFMQHLIDGDFASNNGGWQWSASTGTDAVPYFRIFNPTTQSERFDPDGEFIREFVPELKSLSSKHIHNPPQETRQALDYPAPIVDYKLMRAKVLAAFKNLK